MKCKKCGSKNIRKFGSRPIIRRGAKGKRAQAYLCNDCYHQWRDKG